MTEEEDIRRRERVDAALANGQLGVNDPLLPPDTYARIVPIDSANPPRNADAPQKANDVNNQERMAIAQFEKVCSDNNVSSERRNFFENPAQRNDLSSILYLWYSGKWSDHVKAMERLGIPVSEEDRLKVQQEKEREEMLLNAGYTGMILGAASSPVPNRASGSNLETLTVENAEGSQTPGEEVEEETKESGLINIGLTLGIPLE